MAGMNMRFDNELKQIDARLADSGISADLRRALEAARRSILAAYDPDDNSLERRPRRERR